VIEVTRLTIGRRRGRGRVAGAANPFDAGRDLEGKPCYSACYAPSVSMYFDQFGDVRACCQNTEGLLGNIRNHTIREVWDGPGARRLREALARRDLSVGCGFCRWQADDTGHSAFARDFDRLPLDSAEPEWPVQMEFSMTNSCNLQCEMCNGDWSSSIRAHREHRPPLPAVYRDRFFEELADFLPHLQRANFLGGEPFLGREPLRVMDMIAEAGLRTAVTVTTNGTQWSPRVERICEGLNISFVVSLDGITAPTYESIRVGARFDEVMANIERFRAVTAGTGNTVSITHCLMRPNWREFPQLLRWAEERGLAAVGVNSVLYPRHLSLYQLPEPELAEVVRTLESREHEVADLRRFRHVWDEQLGALRDRLRSLRSGRTATVDPWGAGDPGAGTSPATTVAEGGGHDPGLAPPPFDPAVADALREWAGGRRPALIRCRRDRELVEGFEVVRPIISVSNDLAELLGLPADDFVGRPMSMVTDSVRRRFGEDHELGTGPSGQRSDVLGTFRREVPGGGVEVHEARSRFFADEDEFLVLVAYRRVD
jgi:MoaA/NifB/PqqE/SkfB family radical SAM enzyme